MGERGEAEIVCLVATFTYNKRVSRIATIQEHRMILNAVKKKGVGGAANACVERGDLEDSQEAKPAGRHLPRGGGSLARPSHPIHVFKELRFLKSVRQIEVVGKQDYP
jgi:hypothetical protein